MLKTQSEFATKFRKTLDESIEGNRKEVWIGATKDLSDLIEDACAMISEVTGGALTLRLALPSTPAKPCAVAPQVHLGVVVRNMAEDKDVGMLVDFSISDDSYPIVLNIGGRQVMVDSKEALEACLVGLVAAPRSDFVQQLREIADAIS